MARRVFWTVLFCVLATNWLLAQSGGLAGTWRGGYTCGQAEVGVDLTMTGNPAAVGAVFTFYPVENPSAVTGSFAMCGSVEEGYLQLEGVRWLRQPAQSGYKMVNLTGPVSGAEFFGRVFGVSGCDQFNMRRIAGPGQPVPPPQPRAQQNMRHDHGGVVQPWIGRPIRQRKPGGFDRVQQGPIDAQVQGVYTLNIPSVAYVDVRDYGIYELRTLHVGIGANFGVLKIDGNGNYTWYKKEGASKGGLEAVVPHNAVCGPNRFFAFHDGAHEYYIGIGDSGAEIYNGAEMFQATAKRVQ